MGLSVIEGHFSGTSAVSSSLNIRDHGGIIFDIPPRRDKTVIFQFQTRKAGSTVKSRRKKQWKTVKSTVIFYSERSAVPKRRSTPG
jgi:hypothetical protein